MSTAIEVPQDLAQYTRETAQRAKDASRQLGAVSGAIKNQWLRTAATRIREQTTALLEANQQDIAAAPQFGIDGRTSRSTSFKSRTIDGIAMRWKNW